MTVDIDWVLNQSAGDIIKSNVPAVQLADSMLTQSLGMSRYDDIEIAFKTDAMRNTEIRRAISSVSNYYNTLGMYRSNFDRVLNDTLAKSPYFAICEKAMFDYFGTLEYGVTDKWGRHVEIAEDFLYEPNPEQTLNEIMVASLKDLVRYDAGAIVKSFNHGGYLEEIKAYAGTEFWKEIDRVPLRTSAPKGMAYWSHGYTQRYWQRSRAGIYVAFHPDEVAYMMMYPKSDDVYGTDFLSSLKWFLQYLIDSTRAAGKTFENGIVPSLVWSHPQHHTYEQFRARLKQVKSQSKGSYKFGDILHTIGEEEVSTLSHKLIDMQWLEGQEFVAQLVWAMWGFSISEFMESGGSGKATAYVQRNMTKSRMLKPLMHHYERVLNRQILKHLKGYRKDWKFSFVQPFDYDDEQKQATIDATKAQTFSLYYTTGMPLDTALTLARVDAKMKKIVAVDTPGIFQSPTDPFDSDTGIAGNGPTSKPAGDKGDSYKGGQQAAQKPNLFKKADDMEKARNYVGSPTAAPKGAHLVRGPRGGVYYEGGVDKVKGGAHGASDRDSSGDGGSSSGGSSAGWDVGAQATDLAIKHPKNVKIQRPEMAGFTLEGDDTNVTVLFREHRIESYCDESRDSEFAGIELYKAVTDVENPAAWLLAGKKVAASLGLRMVL